MTTRIAITDFFARIGRFFCVFSVFLALYFTATSARAYNAVVTFTNFPSVVSNTYNGIITLQINGLTNGVTNVVVQKYLDVNTNRVIDSGDLLVQQFRLTAGQENVFTNQGSPVVVTNFLPGDASSVSGQITTPLNFQNGDFAQTIVGQYLYKVSSPSGAFAPVTNIFVVTNTYFSTVITGAVYTASAITGQTNVPNALVLLCLGQNGAVNVQAGTVANSLGNFSLREPPGSYFLTAARSNYVDEVPSTFFQLDAKSTNPFSISLVPANTNITGKVVNSANSNGLAGVSGMVISTNKDLSLFFTDTNGNFYAPVATNESEVVDPFAAAFQGCLTWQTNVLVNVSNKVVNVTNSLPRATAIFYGVVSNSSAVPMPGVYLSAIDNAGHQSVGMTDSHGNYAVGVSAGTNTWLLSIVWPNNPGLTNNYVFSPGYVETNGVQTNEAIRENFTLTMAPYTISGTVEDYSGNPIPNAEVFATNATDQAFVALTASDGTYLLNVSPGTWTVGIIPASLESIGYTNIPANQTVTISTSDATGVNFSLLVCGEIDILTTNLPDAIVGDYYETNLVATSCQSITNWFPAYGITLTSLYGTTNITFPAGTALYTQSRYIGVILTPFNFGVTETFPEQPWFTNCSGSDTVVNAASATYTFQNVLAPVTITAPITNTAPLTVYIGGQKWTAKGPTTANSDGTYSVTLELTEYQSSGSAVSPGQSYSSISGNPYLQILARASSGGTSNTVATILGPSRSVTTAGTASVTASSTPFTNQDDTVVFVNQGGHVYGEYFVSADGPQSTNLPPGIHLYPDGTLAGTPTSTSTNGLFNFTVAAEDTQSNIAVQALSMYVFPAATLAGPSSGQAGMLQSSNTFQMTVGGVTAGLNYTVQMTTNLASGNWTPIYATNASNTNSFVVPDMNATNQTRFYRIEMSQ